MAKLSIKAGSTSQTLNLFIMDSTSTTGAGKTGLAYNTGSLTAYYCRPKASATAITLATQTVTGAFSSGGFVEIDSANMPGWYRLDIPDAAIATGVNSVGAHLKGAANMVPLSLEVELTATDNQDSVRGGMTSLPNVAAGANGGLPTGDASARVTVAPAGLDAITLPTLTTMATTLPGMVEQVWRRFFAKSTITATLLKTYKDDGTTVVTTQTVSDDSTTQTQGAST